MAVKLKFINIIVKRDKIEQKYPGGWEQCLIDHKYKIGRSVWYDYNLFLDGAMSSNEIGYILDHWLSLGFEGAKTKGEEKVWGDDLCVVEGLFGGATLPCDWLEMKVEPHFFYVYLIGKPIGDIIGREEIQLINNLTHI